jgi:UDPglucose 6-dehydrogenase
VRIAVIGLGYVGLVSGACLARAGHDVVGVDSDEERIAALERGELPIYEPGLGELIAANRAGGRFGFATDLAGAVANAEAVFIAVGTPPRASDGRPDLAAVRAAAQEIAAALDGFTVVIDKSTVPVGAGDEVERIIAERCPEADFAVVSNPEFLREGSAVQDFQRPDRIVIGAEDERARRVMAEIYRPFTDAGAPILFTRRRTAELLKYASNAFLAMKVTFINEIADICEAADADIGQVEQGLGLDSRIGPNFLRAGPGFGGSCFPKDTLALARAARDHGVASELVEATISSNDRRKRAMAHKVALACGGEVRGLRIAMLGLAFKAGTDDLRDSPALAIIRALHDQGAEIAAYDPKAGAVASIPGVAHAVDAYAAARDADALVVVTDWPEFRSLDFPRMRHLMRTPLLIDLRNLLDPTHIAAAGLAYIGLGRSEMPAALQQAEAAE